MKFTATDQDNDEQTVGNCSTTYGPGWHKSCCGACMLNSYTGILWFSFQGYTKKID